MVYFIKHREYVKIGFSRRPKNRIGNIQVSLPEKLEVLCIIHGDMRLEQELHSKFCDLRENGEWFFLNEELRDFIDEQDNIKWKYGYGDIVKNELMPVRRLRIDRGLTLEDLGNKLGITRQGALRTEQSASAGTITLNKMQKLAEAMNCYFEFRFVDKE